MQVAQTRRMLHLSRRAAGLRARPVGAGDYCVKPEFLKDGPQFAQESARNCGVQARLLQIERRVGTAGGWREAVVRRKPYEES